ncbi:hypothetical protein FKM82_009859 [Ascaphus truei]
MLCSLFVLFCSSLLQMTRCNNTLYTSTLEVAYLLMDFIACACPESAIFSFCRTFLKSKSRKAKDAQSISAHPGLFLTFKFRLRLKINK